MFDYRTKDDQFLIDEVEALKAAVSIPFLETKLNRYALYRGTDTITSYYDRNSSDKAVKNFTAFFDELNTKLYG